MPVTKKQFRQIIADNNLISVADVYVLLKDISQKVMEAELDGMHPSVMKKSISNLNTFKKRNGYSSRSLERTGR